MNRLSGEMETRQEKIYAFLVSKLFETEDLELALAYHHDNVRLMNTPVHPTFI